MISIDNDMRIEFLPIRTLSFVTENKSRLRSIAGVRAVGMDDTKV